MNTDTSNAVNFRYMNNPSYETQYELLYKNLIISSEQLELSILDTNDAEDIAIVRSNMKRIFDDILLSYQALYAEVLNSIAVTSQDLSEEIDGAIGKRGIWKDIFRASRKSLTRRFKIIDDIEDDMRYIKAIFSDIT